MFPYIDTNKWVVGSVLIHPFVILVAAGYTLGYLITVHRMAPQGVAREQISQLGLWMMAAGFLGSYLMALAYIPAAVADAFHHPTTLFTFTWGLSFSEDLPRGPDPRGGLLPISGDWQDGAVGDSRRHWLRNSIRLVRWPRRVLSGARSSRNPHAELAGRSISRRHALRSRIIGSSLPARSGWSFSIAGPQTPPTWVLSSGSVSLLRAISDV